MGGIFEKHRHFEDFLMKQTACKHLLLALLCSHLSGCGTIISLLEQDYSVYSGVSRDFAAIQEGGMLSIPAAVDLPLSFFLDTLLLPVTLAK